MEITLKNVGLIEDSTIQLDGLTVITGSNNSGKSTVGKALYSIIEGMRDVERKQYSDMRERYKTMLRYVGNTLSIKYLTSSIDTDKLPKNIYDELKYLESNQVLFFTDSDDESDTNILVEKSTIKRSIKTPDDMIHQAEILLDTVEMMDGKLFANAIKEDILSRTEAEAFLLNFPESAEKAKKYINSFLSAYKDLTIDKYIQISIGKLLLNEFKAQIFPVKKKASEKVSFLSFQNNGEIGCRMIIQDNKKIIQNDSIIGRHFINNVILIDNPYILDSLSRYPIFNSNYDDHSDKLKRMLSDKKPKSVLEELVNEHAYTNISDMISTVVPGHMISDNDEFYYSDNDENDIQLRIENMATGSKLFAILQTLLKNGNLNFDTMLILDEPESHLHPEWQNMLAEVIVLLVKELELKVLLTTHSINFVLALETYMRKYKLESISNFYITEKTDDGMVRYRNSTDEMDRVYAKFVESFSRMKAERARYMGDD